MPRSDEMKLNKQQYNRNDEADKRNIVGLYIIAILLKIVETIIKHNTTWKTTLTTLAGEAGQKDAYLENIQGQARQAWIGKEVPMKAPKKA